MTEKPKCEICGTGLEPSELVYGTYCPNQNCERGAKATDRPKPNEKPKPELDEDLIEGTAQLLFDSYAKDWSGDHDTRFWDEIDEEEAREWREEAKELLMPAYEQGKLDLVELLEKQEQFHKSRLPSDLGSAYNEHYEKAVAFFVVVKWLKSQLESSKGEQGDVEEKAICEDCGRKHTLKNARDREFICRCGGDVIVVSPLKPLGSPVEVAKQKTLESRHTTKSPRNPESFQKEDVSLCTKCKSMTHTRLGMCGKCHADKPESLKTHCGACGQDVVIEKKSMGK